MTWSGKVEGSIVLIFVCFLFAFLFEGLALFMWPFAALSRPNMTSEIDNIYILKAAPNTGDIIYLHIYIL